MRYVNGVRLLDKSQVIRDSNKDFGLELSAGRIKYCTRDLTKSLRRRQLMCTCVTPLFLNGDLWFVIENISQMSVLLSSAPLLVDRHSFVLFYFPDY